MTMLRDMDPMGDLHPPVLDYLIRHNLYGYSLPSRASLCQQMNLVFVVIGMLVFYNA